MSTAAIVVVGNEILSAKVVDENGPWLARELRALGVELRRMETVPDEIPLIVDSVSRCRSVARWVFTSGGIGPTHDDVTIPAVAQAFGRRLVVDEGILAMLSAHYGGELNRARRRLAEVPEDARIDWQPGSLFPVVSLEQVTMLPGVPSLFREGFGRLRERYRSAPLFTRALYVSLGEGSLAEHLDAAVARFPSLAVGSYPRFDLIGGPSAARPTASAAPMPPRPAAAAGTHETQQQPLIGGPSAARPTASAAPMPPRPADYRVKVTFDGRSAEEVRAALEFLRARLPAEAIVREE